MVVFWAPGWDSRVRGEEIYLKDLKGNSSREVFKQSPIKQKQTIVQTLVLLLWKNNDIVFSIP